MSGFEPMALGGRAAESHGCDRYALRHVALVALLAFSPFFALWPSTVSLSVKWADTVHRTYTHGYLVLGVVAWMLWRERASLARIPVRPFFPGVLLLVCLGLLWLVAFRAGIQIVHQSLLPVISWLAILAGLGWRTARHVILPVGYLYFAIPVWDAINSTLQLVSVFFVRQMLSVSGVPAFFSGNTFQIPAGAFEIADGCSGLHFMVVALSIGVLYGEVNRDTRRNRILLVVLAGLLAGLANWVRIFIIVMAGHLTNMQHYLIRGEHYNLGWMVFAVMMVLFFMLARYLPVPKPVGSLVESERGFVTQKLPISAVLIALAAVIAVPAWAFIYPQDGAAKGGRPLLPSRVEGWVAGRPGTPAWRPRFVGADEQVWASFSRGESTVEAYAARYWEQSQGKELLGYENSPVGENSRVTASVAPASASGWSESRFRDVGDQEWVLWSAYEVGTSRYTSGLRTQLSYGVQSLFSTPDSTVILLRAACLPQCDAASALLVEFSGAYQGALGGPRDPSSSIQSRSYRK